VELTPLRYFKAIAELRHLTRAAQALGVTQPALSTMLKKLEARVGAELVHRSGRGVELTEAGRVFLEHAEASLRAADQAVASVRELVGLDRGTIRAGAGATAAGYLLPRAISELRRQHPGLRFYVRETGSTAVAQAVLSGELDLGIVTLPLRGTSDLVTIPLVEDELRLIVPPGHALDGKRQFRWADLRGESVIGFEAGSAVREALDRAAETAGVHLDVVMELRSIRSIEQMVAAGVGVGFVSRLALARDAGLACREGKISRKLAIVRRATVRPSAAVAAFERILRATDWRTV
jgi:DNA-binding transcriptional LysR family regulator